MRPRRSKSILSGGGAAFEAIKRYWLTRYQFWVRWKASR